MDQQGARKRQRRPKATSESTDAQDTKRKRGRPKTQCEDCRQSLRHPKCVCLKKRAQPSNSPSPSVPSTKEDAETLLQLQVIEKQHQHEQQQQQEIQKKQVVCSCECTTTLCPCWDCISRYCDCLVHWDLMGHLKVPTSMQVQAKVDE